eukprot:2808983-Prymnesium_polylepis.2
MRPRTSVVEGATRVPAFARAHPGGVPTENHARTHTHTHTVPPRARERPERTAPPATTRLDSSSRGSKEPLYARRSTGLVRSNGSPLTHLAPSVNLS